MNQLASLLRSKLASAAKFGAPQTLDLGHGLHVRVRAAPDQLLLWRDNHEPGEHEGRVCAKQLGWADYTMAWHERSGKPRALIVTKGEALL